MNKLTTTIAIIIHILPLALLRIEKPEKIQMPQVIAESSTSTTITTSTTTINNLIDKYASEYKTDQGLMKKIIACESSFDPKAKSRKSSATGLAQFILPTWKETRVEMNLDTNPELRTNAEESIKTMAFKLSTDGTTAWKSSRKCWIK